MSDFSHLSALFLNCSLEYDPADSHTARLMSRSAGIMGTEGVSVETCLLYTSPRTPCSTSPTRRSPSAPTFHAAVACDSGVIRGLAVSAVATRPITGRSALICWRHWASSATF